MSLAKTKKETENRSYGGVRKDEVIEIMLTKQTHIYDLKKRYDDRVKEAKELGEKLPVITYRDMGIAFQGYVIRRDMDVYNPNSGEMVFDTEPDSDKLIFPKWNNKVIIKQYPPNLLRNMDNCDIEYAIGGMNTGGNLPDLDDMQPRQQEAFDKESKIKASDVPPGKEEKFQKLVNLEKKRVEEWRTLLASWIEATEEVRKHYLLDRLARRYLMCHKENGEYVYVEPKPGVRFKAMVTHVGNNYFTFKPVSWDKEKKRWIFKSGLDTYEPTEYDIKLADLIEKEADRARKEYYAKQGKSVEVEDGENDPGF